MRCNKTEFIGKFESKVILNKSLENCCINKKDLEFVLKHIFKSNLYRVKDYQMMKKFVFDEIYTECNELLSEKFFINDKVFMIWIARKLNHIINEKYMIIGVPLKCYLDEKVKEKDSYDNKYRRQLSNRSLIMCDDNCFDKYLPISKSINYYYVDEEENILYPQFDEELEELIKNYIGNCSYEFNEMELENISKFKFVEIRESDLLHEIINCIEEYKELKDKHEGANIYQSGINDIIYFIREFENINIFCNTGSNFRSYILDDNKWELYDLLKQNRIDYNVNDDFFIIDEYDKKTVSIESFNQILQSDIIDISKWIKYMESHDISKLSEMYIDKKFKYGW